MGPRAGLDGYRKSFASLFFEQCYTDIRKGVGVGGLNVEGGVRK